MDLFLEQINLLKSKKEKIEARRKKILEEKDNLINERSKIVNENQKLDNENADLKEVQKKIMFKKFIKKILLGANCFILILAFVLGIVLPSILKFSILCGALVASLSITITCLSNLFESNKVIKNFNLTNNLEEARSFRKALLDHISKNKDLIREKEEKIAIIDSNLFKLFDIEKKLNEKISLYETKRLEIFNKLLANSHALESKVNALFEEEGLKLERKLNEEE